MLVFRIYVNVYSRVNFGRKKRYERIESSTKTELSSWMAPVKLSMALLSDSLVSEYGTILHRAR